MNRQEFIFAITEWLPAIFSLASEIRSPEGKS